ncbi:immediate early response 2b [Aplochiton taeniatus]
MDVSTEAKRIMAVSISKLYASRSQRGGMRLHRSLLLSMVMRSARDIYHSACLAREKEEQSAQLLATKEELMDTTSAVGEQVEVCQSESPLTPTELTPKAQSVQHTQAEKKTVEAFGKSAEDKENRGPAVSPDRHSRKRRGKAAIAPDFLPIKRARLELRGSRGNSCRFGETLNTLSLNRAIAAF